MKKAVVTFVAALELVALVVAAHAQGPFVRLPGRVQWIAGQKLMLILDYGGGVDIDLREVPLDQYRGLRQGDRVIVAGRVDQSNTKVYASSVQPDLRWSEAP